MKILSLVFLLNFILTLSLFAQNKRYYNSVPKVIIGEWKVLKPKEDSQFESIAFYASGLLNINTKGSKMAVDYKVSESSEGYEVFISGMSNTSFSSLFIKPIAPDNMQITLKKKNSSKTFTLIKIKDISYSIIPLQAKNYEVLSRHAVTEIHG